jgi:hypothetical protein
LTASTSGRIIGAPRARHIGKGAFMQSKMVKQKARASASVVQAADTHAEVVATKAGEKLTPLLQTREKLPDLALLARLAGRALDAGVAALVEADDKNERELRDDAGPRRRRDESTAATYQDLTRVRNVASTSYGATGVEHLGFAGPTPKDPAGVLKLADDVAKHLESLNTLEIVDDAVTVDLPKLRKSLVANAKALRAATEEVGREAREGEATLRDKQRALGEHDETYQAVATLLEGLLLLAGEHELAARVRPSGRSGGGEATEEPGEAPSAPAEG